MLVYVNHLVFEPDNGPNQIIQLLAKWVGQRSKAYIDSDRLAEGVREFRSKLGGTLSSRATVNDQGQETYPYLFSARYSHADQSVSGRLWITEIGLRQERFNGPVECSILLKTDEISARVTEPIQVTRPKLVEMLIDDCRPIGVTPGLHIKRLNEESAPAFLSEVEREGRAHPLVVVSSGRGGVYPVELDRLRSILVGFADVVDVSEEVDTFALQEIIGRRYISYGGAINIVFPMKRNDRGAFCETVLIRTEAIQSLQEDGRSIESEVLAAITHRVNLPNSWRHISIEMVNRMILRSQMALVIERSKASDKSAQLSEYIALLEAADSELQAKEADIDRLRSDNEGLRSDVRKLEANIQGLKHSLQGRQAADDLHDNDVVDALASIRECILSVLEGSPGLYQVLELIAALYPNRISILTTAFDSARDSDRGGFRFGSKAFELLSKLANNYWQILEAGQGDQKARLVFGQNAYAANEASSLSNDGKRRRTFVYRGREFLMEKHLKHGVKDSPAETLRIHFEWLANEKRIVVGHCGKHLDF